MKPDPERPELSLLGVDILAPEGYGEIIGGGERMADDDLLLQRIDEHKLPEEAFDWYLDLRRYGSVPHAGFGMGIERVRHLDLRPRARARDDPLPAHAVPHLPVIQRARAAATRPPDPLLAPLQAVDRQLVVWRGLVASAVAAFGLRAGWPASRCGAAAADTPRGRSGPRRGSRPPVGRSPPATRCRRDHPD